MVVFVWRREKVREVRSEGERNGWGMKLIPFSPFGYEVVMKSSVYGGFVNWVYFLVFINNHKVWVRNH